jgi:hypothetical protein
MKHKLLRHFNTSIVMNPDAPEAEHETIGLRFVRFTASQALAYSHEVQVLHDQLEDEENSNAVKEIYKLNLDLLADQCRGISNLEDEDGNPIELPDDRKDRIELFDALGTQFIIAAVNAFSAGANPTKDAEKK